MYENIWGLFHSMMIGMCEGGGGMCEGYVQRGICVRILLHFFFSLFLTLSYSHPFHLFHSVHSFTFE
jgi:hypothetical protein